MNLNNKAMQRKIESKDCVDLNKNRTIGQYYVLTERQAAMARELPVDFADSAHEAWIWSIARATRDFKFERDGIKHLVPKGTVLASRAADLYQRDGFDCLWLR